MKMKEILKNENITSSQAFDLFFIICFFITMAKPSLMERMFKEKLKDYKLTGKVKSTGVSACYTIENIKNKKKYFMRVLPCLSTLNSKAFISHTDSVFFDYN